MKPFIKWAGGKRWLTNHSEFELPGYEGRYIEPFFGGGAMFFHLAPDAALLSDINPRLIGVYRAIRDDWQEVQERLEKLGASHSKEFYYEERDRVYSDPNAQAAQFLYLNRTCFNGLYRENLSGKFNVPKGTKDRVVLPDDDFQTAANLLQNAELRSCDFEEVIEESMAGDLLFLDPPYTTAHNSNGFLKYNQKIFSWEDQVRLRDCVSDAIDRGVKVVLTNADHESVQDLYKGLGGPRQFSRPSVISGANSARKNVTEAIYVF